MIINRLGPGERLRRAASALLPAALVVSVVGVVVAATPSGAASISTYELALPSDALTTSGSTQSSISCTSSSFCLEAGNYENSGVFHEQQFATSTGTAAGSETGFKPPSSDNLTTNVSMLASSCPSASSCLEVGTGVYQGSPAPGWNQPIAESWDAGTVTVLPGIPLPSGLSQAEELNDSLTALDCTSSTWCIAGGTYSQATFLNYTNFIQIYSDGSWGDPIALGVPGSVSTSNVSLLSVSCWSQGNCEVAGMYDQDPGVTLPFVDEILDGVPQTPTELPLPAGTESSYYFFGPNGISCPAPASCVAVGGWSYGDDPYAQFPLAWGLADGTWSVQSLQLPATPAAANPLAGVSCAAVGECLAVGSSSTTGVPTAGEAYELDGTTWQAPVPIQVPSNFSTNLNDEQLFFDGVSCTSSGFCGFDGSYNDTSDVPQSLVGSVTLSSAATSPGAPTGVAASPSDAAATVSWTAPSDDGGSPITGYTATSSPGQKTCTWSTGPLSCTVTGLTNGTPYTFTVTATNGVGTSSPSTASSPVTPATTPGAPTGVGATAGDGSASVTWTAPASDGGSSISGYTATSSPGQKTCTWSSGPLRCTVTGLINGTPYTFTVTATNTEGAGAASTASPTVVPATVPGAPSDVEAVPASDAATVSWAAPSSDGGSSITGYTVTAAPGAETCTWSAGPLACTVSGLSNGTTYTFAVTATNGAGTGSPASSTDVLVATVPEGPLDVSAAPGDGTAAVTWSVPASDGGSQILGYTATASPGGETCTWSAGPLACTVSGLTDGTAYTFSVTARNVEGTGPSSAPSGTVTPATLPSAPTNVSASPGNGTVAVSWSAAPDGGSPITGYTATALPGGKTCRWRAGPLTCAITGLRPMATYTFSVVASSQIGTSPASGSTNKTYPFDPSGLGVEVASPILSRGQGFLVVVGGASPGARVTFTMPHATAASCTSDAIGQCAVTMAEPDAGRFSLRASEGSTTSAHPIWVPVVASVPRVKRGGTWTITVSSCPVGARTVVTLSDDRTYVARTSAAGTVEFKIKMPAAGHVVARISVNGTALASAASVLVT